MSLSGMTDPRATMLAKANVVDVLGKEGVDLSQWGKSIESLPHCKLLLFISQGPADVQLSLLNLR